MRLYHGCDVESAQSLCEGAPLDAGVAAARYRNGHEPGFYLAVSEVSVEYFAARRDGSVICVEIDDGAYQQLLDAGALRRPIPGSPTSAHLEGDEVFIPTVLFPDFEALRKQGLIDVVVP